MRIFTQQASKADMMPKFRILSCLLLITACLLFTGCNPFKQDPEKSVTMEISSITESSEREEVMEILRGMTDGSGHSMTVRSDRDTMTVTLSPVSDVQAFARRINFGHVDKIDGRTIKIEYVKYKKFI